MASILAVALAAPIIADSALGPDTWFLAVAAFGSLAAAITGVINWFGPWRLRNNVATKLVFHDVRVNALANADTNTIEAIGLGFALRSIAEFPLEFFVTEMHTQIGDKTPLQAPEPKWIEVSVGNASRWDDSLIGVDAPQATTLEATMHATVRFRRRDRNREHELRVAKRVRLHFNPDGTLGGVQWYDA